MKQSFDWLLCGGRELPLLAGNGRPTQSGEGPDKLQITLLEPGTDRALRMAAGQAGVKPDMGDI